MKAIFPCRHLLTVMLSCSFILSSFISKSQCSAGDKPTFGFNFNGVPVANINNGSVDPGESGSLSICDGQSYFVSDHFSSGFDNLYQINNTMTGGNLLLNGLTVSTGLTIVDNNTFLNFAGNYTFTLVDPAISGTLTQTVIPFKDLNNNGILDADDCAGEPLSFIYSITSKSLWYKDFDGDHHASDTVRSCSSPGDGWTTTVLPLDDCNDNDISNHGPTFGFNLNNTSVADINNGSVDPGEMASLTICDSESYIVSGHFSSGPSTLYNIVNVATGGALLLNGFSILSGTTVIDNNAFLNLAGSYTFTLTDPAAGGSLQQTVTPFVDLNNNGIFDAGDCSGDPLFFTYTVTAKLNWYKDVDGDHHASDSARSCISPGYGWTTTVLPVDDCNDNDPKNSGPAFGFTLNKTLIANKNNGSVDPCEVANFTFCDHDSYYASNYFSDNPAASFYINNIITGGALLLNGFPVLSGITVMDYSGFLSLTGSYTFTLADADKSGILKQIITPFVDLNQNGKPDAGECIGDRLFITYNVQSQSTWYKDADCDGFGDPSVSVKACSKPAGYVSNNYDCDDHIKPGRGNEVRVRMCHNGISECVDAKYIWKYIFRGWKLGSCPTISCSTTETVMCHDGRMECVKNKDVQKKLCEPGHHWKLGSCSGNGAARTGIENGELQKTETSNQQYKLSNYPNPFAGSSTIRYEIPYDSKVSIKVYDVMGRVLTTLVNEDKKAGAYQVEFNANRFGKGSFYYRIVAQSKDGVFDQTNKMIHLK